MYYNIYAQIYRSVNILIMFTPNSQPYRAIVRESWW